MIYVDQPIGTGFSNGEKFSDYAYTEDQLAEDFYNFMKGIVK